MSPLRSGEPLALANSFECVFHSDSDMEAFGFKAGNVFVARGIVGRSASRDS